MGWVRRYDMASAAERPVGLDLARDAVRRGELVVLPTDTVYGLVAVADDPGATNRLFAVKGRDPGVPLAVLCTDLAQVLSLVDPAVAPAVTAVAERWWPGPLTLVLPRRRGVELHLGQPDSTVGVRVPAHDLVRAVAALVGPLAATSANRHGAPTPETAGEAAAALGSGIALVVDGGRLAAGASTVIDATSSPWRCLRDGPVEAGAIIAMASVIAGAEG